MWSVSPGLAGTKNAGGRPRTNRLLLYAVFALNLSQTIRFGGNIDAGDILSSTHLKRADVEGERCLWKAVKPRGALGAIEWLAWLARPVTYLDSLASAKAIFSCGICLLVRRSTFSDSPTCNSGQIADCKAVTLKICKSLAPLAHPKTVLLWNQHSYYIQSTPWPSLRRCKCYRRLELKGKSNI